MSDEYREMWRELGLDLEAHDQLLAVLGQAYKDIFMGQPNRPQGMQYFDFVVSQVHGLRIKKLVEGKKKGRKVVGSYCVFVPEELVLAAGATLVGLCAGADFAMEQVERYLPRNTCALIKSTFGFKLGKVCPYLESADLIVGENTCDGKKKSYEILAGMVERFHLMDLPQVKSPEGRRLMKAEIARLRGVLEELTGNPVTAESLKAGIETVNRKRRALLRLYQLRAHQPAPISGLDALLISQISFYDDPGRFSDAVERLCDELEERVQRGEGVFPADAPRVLISGCPMAVPNWKLPWVIEGSGAVIVGEESCVGMRGIANLVEPQSDDLDDLLEALVERYLQIDCAVFTPNPGRRDKVREMFRQYRADGVIHYALQFCQPYQIESLPLEQQLQEEGIPVLRLETDYSPEDLEQLKTRVEAFLEMLA